MHSKDIALTARNVKVGPDGGLGDGQFSAYASVFGNRDTYGDVVVKGAFTADLARWAESGLPIPLLFGHNMSDPDFNIGHVVEAIEDDHGLLVNAQLDLDNPKAAQVYRMLKGGRVNQMSFAYDVLESGNAELDGETVNELRRLKLYEVSVVTIGANQETEVLAVKAAAASLTAKAGRVISARNEATLREARDQARQVATTIEDVLATIDGEAKSAAPGSGEQDQEQASGTSEANPDASEETGGAGNSPAAGEEPKASPSVDSLATTVLTSAVYAARKG